MKKKNIGAQTLNIKEKRKSDNEEREAKSLERLKAKYPIDWELFEKD